MGHIEETIKHSQITYDPKLLVFDKTGENTNFHMVENDISYEKYDYHSHAALPVNITDFVSG